jgi:hypothetical protein
VRVWQGLGVVSGGGIVSVCMMDFAQLFFLLLQSDRVQLMRGMGAW